MEVFLSWLFPLVLANIPALLIIDSARPHFSASTKNLLSLRNVTLKVIPGGLTSLLQHAEVFHFAKLKHTLNHKVDEWILESPTASELTRGVNRRLTSVSVLHPGLCLRGTISQMISLQNHSKVACLEM
jgi:hypothetical protein